MITKIVEVTRIFDWLEATQKRINVIVGGAGSSKSYSIAQHIILNILCKQKDKCILILRKTLPALKLTAYKLIIDLLIEYQIPYSLNKTDLVLKVNSNEIYFRSLDDPEKVKSAEFNYIWIEEATDITIDDYRQLKLRLRRKTDLINQMFLSLNPISALHWIKTEVVDKEDIGLDRSTYKDNPFLSPEYIAEIESLKEQDLNYYKIYALGEWGVLENIIYSNWSVTDIPEKVDFVTYGLDWGFNSPSSLVELNWTDTKFIAKELFYGGGLTQDELLAKAKLLIPEDKRRSELYIDSAEPALIESFYRAGFNAQLSKKDVNDGINYVKTHFKGVTKESTNIIKELGSYSWKKDKNGNVIDEPVKFNDHSMDAIRYASYSHDNNRGRAKNLNISFR